MYVTARIASSGRNHSKRPAVIDLAKKRLELQAQMLKLELAAAKGAAEEREAKQRAQLAVQRITSDVDLMMKRLEWSDQINRMIAQKPHNLQPIHHDFEHRFHSLYIPRRAYACQRIFCSGCASQKLTRTTLKVGLPDRGAG